jgi:hypothetical protein
MILHDAAAFATDCSQGMPLIRSRGRIQHRIPADSSSLQIALAVNFSVVQWLINTSCGATIVGFESGLGHILWSKICQVKPLLSRKRKLQLLPRLACIAHKSLEICEQMQAVAARIPRLSNPAMKLVDSQSV